MKNTLINIFPVQYAKIFCLLILLFFIPFILKAQDKIHKTDSTVIEAKVVEITEFEVKYKKFDNPDGPIYSITKDKVALIVYANGQKDKFTMVNVTADNHTDNAIKDSVQFIENLWGVKFENTQENNESIVRIIKIEDSRVFSPRANLNRLSIYNVNNGKPVRVKTTSELARVLFESYNCGVSKINLLTKRDSKLSYYTYDHKGIDISGLSNFPGSDYSG